MNFLFSHYSSGDKRRHQSKFKLQLPKYFPVILFLIGCKDVPRAENDVTSIMNLSLVPYKKHSVSDNL